VVAVAGAGVDPVEAGSEVGSGAGAPGDAGPADAEPCGGVADVAPGWDAVPGVAVSLALASEVESAWRSTISAAFRSGPPLDDNPDPAAIALSRNRPED
jgi:hypothetical protein